MEGWPQKHQGLGRGNKPLESAIKLGRAIDI